jgi:DNA repair exonuclease SbcCD ATPase subunit
MTNGSHIDAAASMDDKALSMENGAAGLGLEAETDRLYQLPLDAFVEARNALAARLKARGDKDAAGRVKALVRPSVSAWVSNQVYWQARQEFDAFVTSVERLRTAQLTGAVGGAALRDAMKARRDALEVVLRRAEGLLAGSGHGSSPATLLRVSKTLEALAAERGRPAPVRPGRLAQDLEPPGFEALAALGEGGPPASSPKAEPAAEKPRATAEPAESLRAALAEAEKRLDRVRREAREAAGVLSVAEKRAAAARDELDEAKRRLERAQDRAALLAQDEVVARQKAEELEASRGAAEAERDTALSALRAVD